MDKRGAKAERGYPGPTRGMTCRAEGVVDVMFWMEVP